MTTLPKVAESAIKSRVGDKSFARAKTYVSGDRVFDTKRQGRTIKARCEGTAPSPYRIEVTFGKGSAIASAECSCPVGDGGYCKHVAAVLLTWGARPEAFEEVEGVDASLERRSKPELIALVKQMIRREPDLESLLELPLPGTGKGKGKASPDAYKRQASQAFRSHGGGYGWDDYGYGAPDLAPILETGDAFLAGDDLDSASAVYEGLLAAIVEDYETVDDSDGDLTGVVSDAANGLIKCLAGLKNDARREAVLRALLDAFEFNRDYGGEPDEDIPEAIAGHATSAERRTVAGWVRQAMAELGGDAYSTKFRREAYARFLLTLEKDTLKADDLIRIFRDERMSAELVDILLTQGRVDDAVKALEESDLDELIRAAGVFVARKQGPAAERVVLARAGTLESHQARALLAWLKARAAARRDAKAVRTLAEALFRNLPSFEGYKELRGLAGKAKGDWDMLGPALRETLKASNPSELIRALLDDGDVDAALDALAPKPAKGKTAAPYTSSSVSHLRLDVAKAAEKVRPRASLEIYRGAAEREIEARSRDHYKDACRHLKRVKTLYTTLGEPSEWAYYLGVLRERYRTLRAFHEELKAAGL